MSPKLVGPWAECKRKTARNSAAIQHNGAQSLRAGARLPINPAHNPTA